MPVMLCSRNHKILRREQLAKMDSQFIGSAISMGLVEAPYDLLNVRRTGSC
jgi:hypothetical protein